jgi:hypothetical protein
MRVRRSLGASPLAVGILVTSLAVSPGTAAGQEPVLSISGLGIAAESTSGARAQFVTNLSTIDLSIAEGGLWVRNGATVVNMEFTFMDSVFFPWWGTGMIATVRGNGTVTTRGQTTTFTDTLVTFSNFVANAPAPPGLANYDDCPDGCFEFQVPGAGGSFKLFKGQLNFVANF